MWTLKSEDLASQSWYCQRPLNRSHNISELNLLQVYFIWENLKQPKLIPKGARKRTIKTPNLQKEGNNKD